MKEPPADYRGFVFVSTLNPYPKERYFKKEFFIFVAVLLKKITHGF